MLNDNVTQDLKCELISINTDGFAISVVGKLSKQSIDLKLTLKLADGYDVSIIDNNFNELDFVNNLKLSIEGNKTLEIS